MCKLLLSTGPCCWRCFEIRVAVQRSILRKLCQEPAALFVQRGARRSIRPLPAAESAAGACSSAPAVRHACSLRAVLTQVLPLPASAVNEVSEAYERHVRDSLALLPILDSRMAAALAERDDTARVDSVSAANALPAGTPVSAAAPGTKGHAAAGMRAETSDGASGRPQRSRVPQSDGPDHGWLHSPDMQSEGVGMAVGDASVADIEPDPWGDEDGSSGRPQLLDVGSGAGLPGILIAIARPHWQVDALGTRTRKHHKYPSAFVLCNNDEDVACRGSS